MTYESFDEPSDNGASTAFDGALSRANDWADADDYLLNDIGVALRLLSERV